MIKLSRYTDDKINHIESDIGKIQIKPNMYISYSGSAGALHLFKEIVNNSIDECINPLSDGTRISIKVLVEENLVIISDNGRGMPFESMEIACTKLQSGSKFIRATSMGSAGENGVGLTATNALSEKFILISRRYGEVKMIEFEEGELVGKHDSWSMTEDYDKFDKKENGTTVVFKPSEKFLGEAKFQLDDIKEWIENVQYMLPPYIVINFYVFETKDNPMYKIVFQNECGMKDVIDRVLKEKLLDNTIRLADTTTKKETVTDYEDGEQISKEVDRFIGIEFAFNYDLSLDSQELETISFCNFVRTVDDGTHADAVRMAIQQYLAKETKNILTEKESNKIDITFNDVSQGLKLALYLSTNHQVHFASQTKEKVSNKEIIKPIKDMATGKIKEFFKNNPNILKTICQTIKTNAKARIASLNAKKSVLKENNISNLKDYAAKNFMPANNKGPKDYRELIILEGDSAGSLGKMGRYDADTQALFCARGVPQNVHDLTVEKALENQSFRLLVTKLGCNIGDKFDLSKLYYDKIIIATDADIDGFGIDSFYRCAFFKLLRPIVEAGKLYKLVTPLYKIKDKNNPFILDKEALIKVFTNNVYKHVELKPDKKGNKLSKNDVFEFLKLNTEYNDLLGSIAVHEGMHYKIIETILRHRDLKDLFKVIKKKFPEITVTNLEEEFIIDGVYDNSYCRKIIDREFYHSIKELMELYDHNIHEEYYLTIDNEDYGLCSISTIMDELDKYRPQIITRYKGIGELNPGELKEVAMNPHNRRLLRITIKDMEDTENLFNILFGSSTRKDVDTARKEMVRNYKINRNLLDN